VAGGVDQVEAVGFAVARRVLDPDGLGLDRYPALTLELHGVEQLRTVVACLHGAGALEDAVGQRRLPMVDVRDDREVADVLGGLGHTGDYGQAARVRPRAAPVRAPQRRPRPSRAVISRPACRASGTLRAATAAA
jgi:hypothetical protein